MATLTGSTIASSYEQLLSLPDGGGNTTTLVAVTDGDAGTTFAMQLSTTTVCIDNPTADSSTQGGILRLQSDDGALMQSGSRLGVIEFAGAEDSSNTITVGGRIESVTDAAWSATENGADMVFYTTDGNASQSEVMRLTADNLVGIGTSVPDTNLHIHKATAGSVASNSNAQLTIENNTTAALQFLSPNDANNIIYFGDVDDNEIGYIAFLHSSNVMAFAVGDSNRMALDANSRISLSNNDDGTSNTVFGYGAGDSIASGGNENLAIGHEALTANTIGDANIAIGYRTMYDANHTGCDWNVCVGNSSGFSFGATNVQSCVLLGDAAGYAINHTDASGTVAVGKSALLSLTSGIGNVAVGYQSLDAEDDGDFNTAVGYQALTAQTGTSGLVGNTAVGYQSGLTTTTGIENTMVGYLTGYRARVDSKNNTVVGSKAFSGAHATADADDNVAIGYSALSGALNDIAGAVAVGSSALAACTSGNGNTAVGYQALMTADDGVNNTAIGYAALKLNDNANGKNTAVGYNAGTTLGSAYLNTIVGAEAADGIATGLSNTVVGARALGTADGAESYNIAIGTDCMASVTGDSSVSNIAIGVDALTGGTGTVIGNIAIGRNALNATTNQAQTGTIAIGHEALTALTTGTGNVAIGYLALAQNEDGARNMAIGYGAMRAQQAGGDQDLSDGSSDNIFIGFQSGGGDWSNALSTANVGVGNYVMDADAMNGAINNTALGYASLSGITTGDNNIGVGHSAGENITIGADNIAIGFQTMDAMTDGSDNVAIGRGAMGNADDAGCDSNVVIGIYAGDAFGGTAVDGTVLVGREAGSEINHADASGTVAIGKFALTALTDGFGNTALGWSAGKAITTGYQNTAIGYAALLTDDLGFGTTDEITGNTAVGASALYTNVDGSYNTAIGYNALYHYEAESDGEGRNTCIGYEAGKFIEYGTENTFIGHKAGLGITGDKLDGDYNVAIGGSAGVELEGAANNNTFVGYYAGNTTETGVGNVCLGYNTETLADNSEAQFVIGNNTTGIANYTATFGNGSNTASLGIDGSDTSWAAASSDERLKENITTSTAGLSFVNDLRPVTYNWKKAGEIPEDMPQYVEDSEDPCLGYEYGETLHGFIAQEVKTVIDNHSELKEGFKMWKEYDSGVQTVADGNLIPMLVKAVQELSAKVEALENK